MRQGKIHTEVAQPVEGDAARQPWSHSGKTCALCGLPVRRSAVSLSFADRKRWFCCAGCRYVFEILFHSPEGVPRDFRDTDLFRRYVEAGIIPRDEADRARLSPTSSEETPPPTRELDESFAQELSLKVEGMWCSACAWLLEAVLSRMEGVQAVKVFFLSDLVVVTYFPHLVMPDSIEQQVKRLGYDVSVFEDPSKGSGEKSRLLLRLGVSSILTMNIMMISFALYFGFFQELGREAVAYLSYPVGIMSVPVLFYGGLPILRKAYAGVRFGRPSMETLIAVGALSAFLYSLIELHYGGLHLYFDTASMLITVVLLGMYIELQAREKISRGLVQLYGLANLKVRMSLNGRETWVKAESVEPGDVFVVEENERIPVDGIVLEGRCLLDESSLTGESRPVRKTVGDEVMGGTLLREGRLQLRAVRVGAQSSLGQIIAMLQEALNNKNPVERMADNITRWFVPAILGLALGTALVLWGIHGTGSEEAMLRALTVLVITCPCALGIAAPLAKLAAVGIGRVKGILVRDAEALERAAGIDAFVFDKTGTLTRGDYRLQEILCPDTDEHDALQKVASLERQSDHFLAREIVRRALDGGISLSSRLSSVEWFEGAGIRGVVDGTDLGVGNRALMADMGLRLPHQLDTEAAARESQGLTTVFFGWDGKIRGMMVFGDTLKENARLVIDAFHTRGISTWLVSGDADKTTAAVARKLGVENYAAHSRPGDKCEMVKRLQKEGHCVGMLGDGINDSAALAQADVGIALAEGGSLLYESAGITLLTGDPQRVIDVHRLSAVMTRTFRQNLFFAFVYNALGIPLAAAGVLNPLIAVLAMFMSSLTVIANTLRMPKRFYARLTRPSLLNSAVRILETT